MKNRGVLIRGISAAVAMLVMILDAKTAVSSAQEGMQLCIRTVIPSLFPFFVLSGLINSCLLGQRISILRPLRKFCKIPEGTESLLVLGFLAGYPVGAQLIAQSYRNGKLSAITARRMLGFCNNVGPAFLFGMLSPLFTRTSTVWVLWGIQIASSLITAYILPVKTTEITHFSPSAPVSFPDTLQNAIRSMASVCGWVIIFRVILGFCNRWFMWLFPIGTQVLFSGTLELANGCISLQKIPQQGLRFLLAGTMLSFGGLCVGMQTASVTGNIGTGWYFPGKVLQTTLTILLSILTEPLIFQGDTAIRYSPAIMVAIAFMLSITIFIVRRKKVVAFPGELLYNTGN